MIFFGVHYFGGCEILWDVITEYVFVLCSHTLCVWIKKDEMTAVECGLLSPLLNACLSTTQPFS